MGWLLKVRASFLYARLCENRAVLYTKLVSFVWYTVFSAPASFRSRVKMGILMICSKYSTYVCVLQGVGVLVVIRKV